VTKYAIGLGSNLGDRLAFLRAGVAGLGALGELEGVSGLYETAPIGGPDQGQYLNAVALVDSDLGPHELLAQLNVIEAEQKRERKERWDARTLDLDIVAAEGLVVDEPDLTIPHPRAAEREFVLRPLADVWPNAPIAEGISARVALDSCDGQGVDRLARVWVEDQTGRQGRLFVGVQIIWFVTIAIALAWDGSLPDGAGDGFRILGVLLGIYGAGQVLVSSRRLGPALTVVPEPTDEGVLVQGGPYRLVRHPMYGGVTLFILGTSMVLDSVAGALLSLGLFPFFYMKSKYEEQVLRIRYSDYRAYRDLVRRRFIPFLF